MLASACASADPRADFAAAAASASSRLGAPIDWADAMGDAGPRALPGAPLTAAVAVELALHNHPEIRGALAQLAAAKAAWAQAGRLPNPMLDVMVGIPVDGMGGDPLTASLLQSLTWLWARGPRTERAAAELRAQALRACDLAVASAAAARAAHARLVFAEREVALARALRDVARAASDVVAQRLAVGEASDLDRGAAAIEALEADDQVAQAELGWRRAQQEVLARCGLATAAASVVSDGVILPMPAIAISSERAVDLAGARFDVQAALATAEAAAAGTVLARRGRWPEVSVGARYERMEDGREILFPTVTLVPRLLDDGRVEVSAAEANARAAAHAAESVWQDALTELSGDIADYDTARASALRQRHAILPLARTLRDGADASLAAGVVEPSVAFTARVRALRAELAANAAERAAAEALIELERAAGARLAEPKETPP